MATNFERTVYIIEMRDKVSMPMNRATQQVNRFNRSMVTARSNATMMSSAIRGLAIGGVATLAYGIARATANMVKFSAELEKTRLAFEVMMSSQQAAADLFRTGFEFARATPYKPGQVFGMYKQLLAYGVPEQNIAGYGRVLAEIGAGVGMEKIPMLSLALGQVVTKGRLQGQELRQFTEHGVGIVQELSKVLGVKASAIPDMIRKGQVSSQNVVDALIGLVSEGGRFEGMLQKLRGSFRGTQAVMIGTWQMVLDKGIQPMMEGMKGMMEIGIKAALVFEGLLPVFGAVGTAFDAILLSFEAFGKNAMRLFDIKGADLIITPVKLLATLMLNTFTILENVITIAIGIFTPLLERLSNMYAGWQGGKNIQGKVFGMLMGAQKEVAPSNIGEQLQLNKRRWRTLYDAIWAPTAVGKEGTLQSLREALAGIIDLESPYGAGDEGGTAGGRKRVANRLVGTGARDIVIHIGNLIENMQISSPSIGESAEQLTERVKMAMLTAINDASILADR